MTPDQVKVMQRRLGFSGGAVDGIAGRGTYEALFARLGAKGNVAPALGIAAAVHFPRFGISDRPLRLIHMLGQAGLETGGFFYFTEVWGPTKTQLGYEGRADLGNTVKGDGRLMVGRGIFMTTGRANYRAAARKLGIDVEAEPTLLGRPDIGLQAACIWWQDNGAERWADADDAVALSRLVNRGSATTDKPANHEEDRIRWTNRARALIV